MAVYLYKLCADIVDIRLINGMAKDKENIGLRLRTAIVLAISLFSISSLAAQHSARLVWGPDILKSRPEQLLEIFGGDDTHFYTLTSSDRKGSPIVITKTETDSLRQVKSAILTLPLINGLQPLYLQTLSFAGKAYLLSTVDDPAGDEIVVYAHEVDEELKFALAPKLLGSIPRNVILKTRFFRVVPSENNAFLLVLMPQEDVPDRNEKFELRLLDENLGVLYEKKLEVPYPTADVSYGDILVDEDKAVYVLMSKASEQLREVGKVQNPGRDHFLLKYTWQGNLVSEKSLSIGVKWIYNVHMAMNTAGHLQVFGYFSNMIELAMAGTFSVAFDTNNGQIVSQGLSPFERSFKAQFRPIGNLQERHELSLYQTDYTYARKNNRVLMLSEKRDMQSSTMFNPATGTYFIIQNYIFDELLLTSLNPAGAATYNIKIPKYQSSSREIADFVSFLSWQSSGSTFMAFNDHERNASLELNSGGKYTMLSGYAGAQAVMYEFAEDGGMYKHILFTKSPQNGTMLPGYSYALSDGVVLFTASSTGWQFVRLIMEKTAGATESE